MEHNELLSEATNRTHEIFHHLEHVASLSAIFSSVTFSWWPHIVFPIISLVAGSYGLQPSVFRNLVLVALGECFGVALTVISNVEMSPIWQRVTSSNQTTSS
jgi:hypothetical protein